MGRQHCPLLPSANLKFAKVWSLYPPSNGELRPSCPHTIPCSFPPIAGTGDRIQEVNHIADPDMKPCLRYSHLSHPDIPVLKLEVETRHNVTVTFAIHQCCGSKYIEFGSGSVSRILAKLGSGSRVLVLLSILKEKIQNNVREKFFTLKQVYF